MAFSFVSLGLSLPTYAKGSITLALASFLSSIRNRRGNDEMTYTRRPSSPGCGLAELCHQAGCGSGRGLSGIPAPRRRPAWSMPLRGGSLDLGLWISHRPRSKVNQSQELMSGGGACVGKLRSGPRCPLRAAVPWDRSLPIVSPGGLSGGQACPFCTASLAAGLR